MRSISGTEPRKSLRDFSGQSEAAGAQAGCGSASQVKRLAHYGQELGLAFQLIDDVQDDEGLAQVMGIEAASAEARRLIARAVAQLEPFGSRANTLRDLAGWLSATAAQLHPAPVAVPA